MNGPAQNTTAATDPDHLRTVQYRDGSNLAKRANLHVAYRTAPVSAFELLASAIPWPKDGDVLDVGCGTGLFWGDAAERVKQAGAALRLTLLDLSPGMVEEATARAGALAPIRSVQGRVADARSLPFDDDSFDLIVSTYALYHVPEPDRALDEMVRVLRPGGRCVIMTNGPGHLAEIEEARVAVFGDEARYEVNDTFSPAIAATELMDRFNEVTWTRYDDTLAVTDLEDVVAFMMSSAPALDADDEEADRLRQLVADRMDASGGVFTVSKHTGFFICSVQRASSQPSA